MRHTSAAILCAVLYIVSVTPTFALDNIGKVERVSVWAYGTPPQAKRQDLFVATPIYSRELVQTVHTGSVSLRFLDGTRLALGSDSALTLDEMVYNPGAKQSFVTNLSSGIFHLLSGGIDKEAVKIVTPAGDIGLRGTELVIIVRPNGTTILVVLSGLASATPRSGGATVLVRAGQTATLTPGIHIIKVSSGIPVGLLFRLPAVGPSGAGLGAAGGHDASNEGGAGISTHSSTNASPGVAAQ